MNFTPTIFNPCCVRIDHLAAGDNETGMDAEKEAGEIIGEFTRCIVRKVTYGVLWILRLEYEFSECNRGFSGILS